jgi:YbbR domain-containing protein
VAILIAVLLWGVAQGSSDSQEPFDVPVVFENVPEDLVITDQNSDVINIRVQGSRAALRNVEAERLAYVVDASGARRGSADFDVPQEPIVPPRGARVVSRSPSRLEVKFERRGTKVMNVRPEITGKPAQGFRVAQVVVEPPRVRVTGARREVLRLSEAVTEAVDLTDLTETTERQVRLNLGGQNVWVEDPTDVTVRVEIEAEESEEPEEGGQG